MSRGEINDVIPGVYQDQMPTNPLPPFPPAPPVPDVELPPPPPPQPIPALPPAPPVPLPDVPPPPEPPDSHHPVLRPPKIRYPSTPLPGVPELPEPPAIVNVGPAPVIAPPLPVPPPPPAPPLMIGSQATAVPAVLAHPLRRHYHLGPGMAPNIPSGSL